MDWILTNLAPPMGSDHIVEENPTRQPQMKKKSISNSANSGSSSGSTPVADASPIQVVDSAFLNLCSLKDNCAIYCASDDAGSMAAPELLCNTAQDGKGGKRQHYRRGSTPRRRHRSTQGATNSKPPKLKSAKSIEPSPPQVISVYHQSRTWPDGTLQILWQRKEQNSFGIKGVDMFEAHLELTFDDLKTIEISSEIASRYSNATVEVHPDETVIERIGSITCYLIQPVARELPTDAQHKDCPPLLQKLLSDIPHSTMFQSWRKNEVLRNDHDWDDFSASIDDIHWRHHWYPTTKILSYLWIQDVSVTTRYRGVGLGLCLIEDACKRVAEGLSWVVAAPPPNTSLEDYFSLMGFAPLHTSDAEKRITDAAADVDALPPPFLARWNASPLNPSLEEVVPSVPFTPQQFEDQGFDL